MSTTRLTVLLAAAAVFAAGCDTEIDEARAAELAAHHAQAADVLLETLESQSNPQVGSAFDREPTLADDVLDALADMAAEEPCEIRGTLAGLYGDGELHMAAGNQSNGMIGGVKGRLATDAQGVLPMEPGHQNWSGTFWTHGSALGDVTGRVQRRDNPPEMTEHLAPMAVPYVPAEMDAFGTFTAGVKGVSRDGTIEGHIFGLWVPSPSDASQGLLIAHYATCEDEPV